MTSKPHVLALLFGATALTAVAPPARANDRVEITFTTTPTSNPRYYPRNVLAVWVVDANGGFVRTLMRYAQRRVSNLRAWRAVASDTAQIGSMPDVITGATRTSHGTLTATWDMTDLSGNPVAPGDYTIRLELTDHDTNTTSGSNEGTFTFTHGGASSKQNGMSNGGFENVTVTYTADTTDPGDPGTPGECSATTECIDNDGCCHPDCVFEVDNDCDPDTEHQVDTVGVGCSTGGGAGGGAALLLVALIALRVRRTS